MRKRDSGVRHGKAILIGLMLVGLLAACRAPGMGSPPILSPSVTWSPMPMATPTLSPTPTFTPQPTPTERAETVTLTVIYDNNPSDPRFRTAWGFACWVETPKGVVLFDTGGDGPTLLNNLAEGGMDSREVDAVVLSHAHGDHTGGLTALLDAGARPTIYVPASFSPSFKESVRARTVLVEVTGPTEVLSGIHTTGEVGSGIVEQALVVETAEGLVVVTGCAHPGIVEMVRRARQVGRGKVALVVGGFHLSGADRGRIAEVISGLQALGVRRVAPCHCTGDLARRMFADVFGADFLPAGAGWGITFRR